MGRRSNLLQKLQNGEKKTQCASFNKRKSTLMKKGKELAALCDVLVCVVCFAPNGEVYVWPDNPDQVKDIILRYKGMDDKLKKETTCLDHLRAKKSKLANKMIKEKIDRLILSLCEKVEGLSGTPLMDFVKELEGKVENFKRKIDFLRREEEREGKAVQVGDQEIGPSSSMFESTDAWLANIDNWLLINSSATCRDNLWVGCEVKKEVLLDNNFPVNAICDENNSMAVAENNSNFVIQLMIKYHMLMKLWRSQRGVQDLNFGKSSKKLLQSSTDGRW